MVAAVAAMALLATLALVMIGDTRAGTAMAAAERGQAQAAAAADAGLVLALGHLLVADRAGRWSIDGRERHLRYAGMALAIRVEDERGKVPLAQIDEATAARLAEAAGLPGERGRIAAQSLLDWTDDDDEPRAEGAERAWYASRGRIIRNGLPQTIEELAEVRGWDRAALARVRPFITLRYRSGGFEPRFASPQAIGVMLPGGANGAQAIIRQRELSGQTTAIELGEAMDLTGRPLTVAVDVSSEGDARLSRRWLVELTGDRQRPYVVRAVDSGSGRP